MAKKKKKKASIALPTETTQPGQELMDYKTMFFGPPGVGKTTFVNDMGESVLFLSTDQGTRFLDAMRVEVDNAKDLLNVLKALKKPGACNDYDIICVDHIDDICGMLEDDVLETLGVESLTDAGWGKGWKAYRKQITIFVRTLMALKPGLVFIAHEAIKTVKTRALETERTMPRMTKTAWEVVIPLCDVVGYCGFRTLKMGREKKIQEVRTLETQPREDLYVKDRTGRKQPKRGYELLDGAKFVESFTQGADEDGEEKEKRQGKKKVKKVKRGRRSRK